MQLFIYFLKYLLIYLEAEDIFSFFWAEVFLKTAEHILCVQESITQAQ